MINVIIIALTCMVIFTTSAFAAGGRAVIPHHNSMGSSGAICYYFLSNITSKTVSVTVTLYDKSGSIIKDDVNISTGTLRGSSSIDLLNYNDNPTNGSITFNLAANSTGYFYIVPPINVYGYGYIEWSQTDWEQVVGYKEVVALVSNGFYYLTNESRFTIPINAGKPF